MERLSFKVADFDAPLDLILHLISSRKLQIADIDISSLLDQYMQVIESWQAEDMDVASEFLEMASRLVHIKTVSLLPKHEEEGDKLRQELSGQLIEYSVCKAAAKAMGSLYLGQDIFVRQTVKIEIDPTYDLVHEAYILYGALADAMGKGARRLPPPREAFDPLVARPVVSVTAKIFTVLRTLRAKGSARLISLYGQSPDRSGKVATFLAILELIKSGKVYVSGEDVTLK